MNRVLVTGASGGLGGGVLAAFAAAGWQIAGTTRGELPEAGADAAAVHWLRADLAEPTGARRAVDGAVRPCPTLPFRPPHGDRGHWADGPRGA